MNNFTVQQQLKVHISVMRQRTFNNVDNHYTIKNKVRVMFNG